MADVGGAQQSRCGNVKPMSQTAATNHERRLAWLDALRGFAALCVVFDHGSTLLLLPVRSFLYEWLNLGQYGVFVFFLVSGYIVPASLERKGSVRGFWISRAFRLYPMFVLVLVLSAVAHATGHGTVANAGTHPVAAVLGWLFMMQNLAAGLNVPVVTWTLSYEMVFYLLLAGLFSWGVHRRSGWYATAFAVGAVALGGILPMAALGHWSNRPGDDGALVLNAITDALLLAGLGLTVLSRSWPAKAGASLAAVVALVLVTFNQGYPYPWSGCVILALMFTGTAIYRVWGGAPPAPPGMGGLRPPISPPREDAQKARAPRAVARVKALWLRRSRWLTGVVCGSCLCRADGRWGLARRALRVPLAGAVGDVGSARRGDVRGRAGRAADADPSLVRLARRDQLLGLPAAPAGL